MVPLAVTIATLYLAQEILIPLALAVLLAFLLAPFVKRLENRGLGRIPSVLAVVVLAFAMIGGLGWIVGSQAFKLADDLPHYQDEIGRKVRSVSSTGGGMSANLQKLFSAVQNAGSEAGKRPATSQPEAAGPTLPVVQGAQALARGFGQDATLGVGSTAVGGSAEHPMFTEVVTPQHPIQALMSHLGLVLGPLGTAGVVVVFVVFILLEREDLRDRIISLVSRGRYTVTTQAVNEAGTRISRFVRAQVIVNGSYGVIVALALAIIGPVAGHGTAFPSFVLWGFLSATLRFIPYVGALTAAAFPVAISLAVFPGFAVFLATLGTLIAVELVVNNAVEPWLYGASTGISTVALLVSAIFWTWLWGLPGLLLSTPLTVCIVVLGKYVPQLKFLDVLLGDEPALPPAVAYYQRLLAGDRREAWALIHERLSDRLGEVPDVVLLPALRRMRRDRDSGELSAELESFILDAVRSDTERLQPVVGEANGVLIVGCPAHHPAEEAALRMLAPSVAKIGARLELLSTRMLPAEVEAFVSRSDPAILLLAVVPPGGLTQARYLCRRLRRKFPDLKIVVGYFGKVRKFDSLLVRLRSAGASYVTTSIAQSDSQLKALLFSAPSQPGVPVVTSSASETA